MPLDFRTATHSRRQTTRKLRINCIINTEMRNKNISKHKLGLTYGVLANGSDSNSANNKITEMIGRDEEMQ